MEEKNVFLDEFMKMKEEMDRVWNNLFKKPSEKKFEEVWQWVEKLPKFEGAGRSGSRSRSIKTIRSH